MRLTLGRITLAVACIGCLGGCGVTRHPLPEDLAGEATVAGMRDIRAWGDKFSPVFQANLVESVRQVRAVDPRGVIGPNGYVNVLAISGGGPDGAFGAGLLCGWTEAGDRPSFKLVTGISTGALTAPFAFVGPEYDGVLKRFYTTVNTADIYTKRPVLSVLFGSDSLTDNAPLARLIAQVVDEKLLAAVAKAHSQGRRLYIGTTNLDASRLTVWNMGAIASHGGPEALDLFRKVMRASASIPVAFPPVLLQVQARGRQYDEMYVDGGASVQVFFYGSMLDLKAAAHEAGVAAIPPVRIYVIRNDQLKSTWQTVQPRLLPIAARSVSTLLYHEGVGDLFRIYTVAHREGIDYKFTSIPDDFQSNAKQPFDPEEMTRLFETAFKMAKRGYPWQSLPPGLGERPPVASQPAGGTEMTAPPARRG